MSETGLTAKEKILTAAVDEFGKHGYNQASTNNIVAKAGISKGLLFHYFGSKENLHIQCLEYWYENFWEDASKLKLDEEKDYFQRTFDYMLFKVRFANEHPMVSRMFFDAYNLSSNGDYPKVTEIIKRSSIVAWEMLLKDVDTSKYKKDLDIGFVQDYIRSVLDMYSMKFYAESSQNYEILMDKMDGFVEVLRHIIEAVKYGVYEK